MDRSSVSPWAMPAALLMNGLMLLMCVLVALGPRRLPGQVADLDQYRLDQALRATRRSWTQVVPVCAGLISAVHAGSSFAMGRSSWPVWLLACGVSATLLVMQRRNRPVLEQVLLSAGARPPDAAQEEHDARQGRWTGVAAGLFVARVCCRVFAQHEPLRALSALEVLLTLAFIGVVLVVGWRAVRGPDPEPIVLWHRDG